MEKKNTKIEPRVEIILNQILEICQAVLQKNLQGIYVHGSLAFGCFRWEQSDLDFLILTKEPPSLEEKIRLMERLLAISDLPPKGLEMSLVLKQYANSICYPTPFELHYSLVHEEHCRKNLREYCKNMNGTDKDLAAHFTVTRQVGIALYGETPEQMFGKVPKEYYFDSLKEDITAAIEKITENPVYFILNLCRVLAYAKEGLILSKEEGGYWGQENLPPDLQELVEKALECYQGKEKEETFFLEKNKELKDFARILIEQISLIKEEKNT